MKNSINKMPITEKYSILTKKDKNTNNVLKCLLFVFLYFTIFSNFTLNAQTSCPAPNAACTPPTSWDKDVVVSGNTTWSALGLGDNENVTTKIRITGTGKVVVPNGNLLLKSSTAVIFVDGVELVVNAGNLGLDNTGSRFLMNNGTLRTFGNFQQTSGTVICITGSTIEIGDELAGGTFNTTGNPSSSANWQNDGGYRYLLNNCINVTHDFQLQSSGSGTGISGVDVICQCCIEIGDRGANHALPTAFGVADGDDSGNWQNSNNQTINGTTIVVANGSFQNSGLMTINQMKVKVNKSGSYQAQSGGTTQGSGLCVAVEDIFENNGTWTATGISWFSDKQNSTNVPGAGSEQTQASILANCFTTCCNIGNCVKPSAGADQSVCQGTTATLTGTNLTTGTWTAQSGNPSGATLGSTSAGIASVTFSGVAIGTFKFIYSVSTCTDTLSIIVKAKSTSSTNVSVCSNTLPYLWNGINRNAAGTYTFTTINSVGCDSVATLVLNVKPTSTSTTNVSVCSNTLPYLWNGINRNAAGTYTFTTTNSVGCDSVATLILTVKATSTSSTSVSVCSNTLPYLWNGINRNAAGTYTFTTTNSVGCDSVVTLILTVKATSTSSTSVSVCSNTLPYLWNGINRNAAGTYTFTTTNSVGCDSVATLILTVKATSTSSTSVSVCSNTLPYLWNGINRNAAGTYTFTTINSVGCDSVATLVLNVKPTSTSTTNVSVCSNTLPYLWNGTNYNAAGTYTYTTTNSVGCDSVATLVLNVKLTSTSTTNVSVCSNTLPYLWNGINRNAAGTYTFTTTNSVGCDSVATLVLNVKPTSTSSTNVSVCSNTLPYLWNGINRNAAGTYTFTTTNSVGCDSVATLVLNVKPTSTSTTNVSVCSNTLPYLWNGINRNAAGTYTFTTTNSVGCDSVATLVLNVKPTSTSTTNVSVCSNTLPYLWNGINRNAAGTYTFTTINSVGCDSVATLELNVKPTSTSSTNVSVCSNTMPYLWNGTNYNAAGTYTFTTTNSVGCDSVATLVLNVTPVATVGNYVWNDINGDGLNNEPASAGINGVTVELWNATTNTLISSTVTANNGGNPGYYNFEICTTGDYKIKFPTTNVGNNLTAPVLTAGTDNNSDANTTTGFSPTFTINTTGTGIQLNNPTIDAGYNCNVQPTCSPITKCIGLNATNAVLAAVTPAGGTITWNTGNAATATGYTYTITNSCGSASCSSTITRVNITPITGSIITICTGVDATSAVLAGVTPAGGTITWNTGNATTATGYTYTVTSGCGAQNFTSVITRIPLPTTPNCSPITVCVGSNATADVTAAVSPAGGVITWNTGNATTATSYTYTVSNSCGSASCTNTITRNNPTVAHSASVAVCVGVDATSAVLPFVSPAGGTITWNTGNATTATSYTYTISGVCGTQSSTSAITRTALPSVPTCGIVSITTGLDATTAVMAAVSPAGGTITWNTGNATTATSYTYTVSNLCGSASCACTITRTPLCVAPTFSSTVPSYSICQGQPITINVTNAGTLGGSGSFASVYSNNFNTSIGSNWTFPATSPVNVPSILSYNGESMLGALQGQKAEFNMTGLPTHNTIKVEFDLYLFDTWDGNDIWVGEDKWKMDVDNTNIINTTFSNFSYRTQAYPGNIPAINPNGTGSIANNLPTRCNTGGGALTSKYRISKTIPHTSSSLKVVLEGLGLEELCNESWAFDNFSVEYNTTGVTSNVIWTNPPVSANTISNNASITVSPSSSTYYVADMNGCKDTVRVTVIPTPVTPVCGTITLCQGLDATSAVLAVVSPAGGVITWNTGDATTATSFTYIITNSICTASSTGTINRLSLPATPTCAPVSIGTGVNATAAVMAAVSPAGGVITWNTGNASTATSYTYTVTNSCGTATCACTITRTIDCVKPTFSSNIPSYTVCAGQPITINVTNATSTVGAVGSYNAAYSNNFNSSVDGNWTFPATYPANTPSILSYNGESMLGALQGQKAEFNMAGLPAHDSIKVDFDLYLFDTWDGNDTWVGVDRWKMDVDNNSVINTTFSNFSYRTQAYPGNIPTVNPNGTGSIANNLPPRCNLGGGAFTSKYHISRTVAHSASSIKVVLEGLGLEELCNESWAFDNFSLQYSGNGSVTTNVAWTNPPVSANTISTSTSITVNPTTSTYYVANMDGCRDTVRVTVLPNPIAPNTAPLIVCNGLDATAAILLATSPQGGVITFNTGNGATATSYTYTITNANNCSASATNTITRTNSTIAIACAPLTLAAGIDATAAVTAAVSPAGGVIIWNTGNANTATSYTYSLVACGCGGSSCSNIITRTGLSTGTGNASFNTIVGGNCDNYITTTNTTTGTGNSYLWDFGDGSTSNEVSPSHYYINGGVKTITLTVTKGSTITTATNNVNISANSGMNGRVGMTVAISPSTTQVLLGNSFAFTPTYTNNSTNSPGLYCAGTPNWTFGDGTTSTGTVIYSKSYAAAGTYTARIIQQTTNTGCFSEVSKVITVTPNPLFAVNKNPEGTEKYNAANEKASGVNNINTTLEEVELYPNPNAGKFSLSSKNIDNASQIVVIDILGREISVNVTRMNAENRIDLEMNNVSSGYYFIIIKNESGQDAKIKFNVTNN